MITAEDWSKQRKTCTSVILSTICIFHKDCPGIKLGLPRWNISD